MLVLEEYELESSSGKTRRPFTEWFSRVKDDSARRAVQRRLRAVEQAEHFGDFGALGEGLLELRIHYQQGLRIYCARVGRKVVLLLGGSEKRNQQREMASVRERLAEFRARSR